MVGKLILILAIGVEVAAQESLSPIVFGLQDNFEKYRSVVRGCLNGSPSQNRDLGCVDSAKYMNDLCKVKFELDFKTRYAQFPRKYFYEACELFDSANVYLQNFIELDIRGCVRGFESLQDRLMTVSKNREILDERVMFNLEKSSCREFRNYVNLCNYVDGHLTKLMPESYEHLPKIDFDRRAGLSCQPSRGGDAQFIMSTELTAVADSPTKKVYEKIISDYRSRIPDEKDATYAGCDEVRTTYANLRCDYFDRAYNQKPIFYGDGKGLGNN